MYIARRMRRAAALVIALAALGCDGPSGAPAASGGGSRSGGGERLDRARREMGLEEVAGGDADEDDALTFAVGPEHFPALPEDVTEEGPPLADGLARAAESFSLARPALDAAADDDALQRWVENDFSAWVRARAEALRIARSALEPAERGEIGEYVVASAVIGVLYARFAELITTIPPPSGLTDPGDRLRFRDALLQTAASVWDRAADALGGCAAATVRSGDSSLDRWQRFCDGELQRVEDAPRPIE
jgi:hypothetical protein